MPAKKRYEHKITLGKDIAGNLIRKSFYSTKSKRDAKRKAEEYAETYKLNLLLGEPEKTKTITFEKWAIRCLELYKMPYVKANTYRDTYLAPVKRHLIPHFGKREVQAIQPAEIQEYINSINGKYAPETIKKDFNMLHFILQHAKEEGYCKENAAASSGIRLPKYHTVVAKHAFSPQEYNTTYEFAVNHPKGLAIMLLMETGCSRSELLGLRYEDFDAEHGNLHINQGLVAVSATGGKKTLLADGLKNGYRQRTIPILEPRLLARLKAEPKIITLESGGEKRQVEAEFIFHSPEGKAYYPRNWYDREYRSFMKDLIKAHPEIPSLTPHELRHTRATLWSAQGVPQHLIADLLGHCDTRMLERVYNHTTTDTLRQALEAVQTKEGERA